MKPKEFLIHCGSTSLPLGRTTMVMGILNVAPDSFSDGGRFSNVENAVQQGLKLMSEGAHVLDIGGVATSPCAARNVSEHEELERVIPVVRALAQAGVTALCVDTQRAEVAYRALNEGASWINDQSAGQADVRMPAIMAKALGVVLMHDGGGLSGVHAGELVTYHNVIDDLRDFFAQRIHDLAQFGVEKKSIIIDPGIGFAKGMKDTIALINNLHEFHKLDVPVLVGLSRKSFIGQLSGITDPAARDYASLGAHAAALRSGAHMIRTHNVRATIELSSVLDQIWARSV